MGQKRLFQLAFLPLYCDVITRDATLSLLVHPETPSDHLNPLTLINSYELIEITVLIVPAIPSLLSLH